MLTEEMKKILAGSQVDGWVLEPQAKRLLSLAGPPLSALRRAFRAGAESIFDGPSGVTFHPLSDPKSPGFVVQNFNTRDASVSLRVAVEPGGPVDFTDRFAGKLLPSHTADSGAAVEVNLTIPARGRAWVQEASRETSPQ